LSYLALGSNVGDRLQYLRDAIARLRETPGVNLLRLSRVYETEPVGVTEQPRFLNMVAEVEIGEETSARDLLRIVKQIESEVGRIQRERWGPREIDIDVLLVGDEEVREEDLELPHPRMWERAFVMVPLAELAPEVRGPSGETAGEIAERLKLEEKAVPFPQMASNQPDTAGTQFPDIRYAMLVSAGAGSLIALGGYLWGFTRSPGIYALLALFIFLSALLSPGFLLVGMVLHRRQLVQVLLRLAVLACVAALMVGGFVGSVILFKVGLRQGITRVVSLDDLQSAAVLLTSENKGLPGSRQLLERDSPDLPDAFRKLGSGLVVVPGPADEAHVEIHWGSGFRHYGLMVGGPQYRPRRSDTAFMRLQDGVYGFSSR